MSPSPFDVHVADGCRDDQLFAPTYWSDYLASLAPLAAPSVVYYRSQVATEKTGINPLVKAAAPLMRLLGKLNIQQIQPTGEFLIYLEHEFKAFVTQSNQLNYNKDVLQMAYHILQAAFLEAEQQSEQDVIEVRSLGKKTSIDFFSLVEQSQEAMPLDLLELGYLLISLGYRGKYRSLPDGKFHLDQLRKQLYQQIRAGRGEYSKVIGLDDIPVGVASQRATSRSLLRVISIATMSLLVLLYGSFNYVLGLTAAPTYQELQRIQQTLAGSNDALAARQ